MPTILDSIQQAKQQGASSDAIIGEIIKQNPDKAQVFQQARSQGANGDAILAEIEKQNTPQGATGLQGVATGVDKGIASTLARPFQSIGAVIGSATTKSMGTGVEESLASLSGANNKALELAYTFPTGDPRRQKLIDIANEGKASHKTLSSIQAGTRADVAQTTADVGGIQAKLAPVGTAENIGFGLERVGEFLVPGAAVSKLEKATDIGIKGIGIGTKVAQGEKILEGGAKFTGLVRTQSLGGKIIEKGLQTAAHSAIEATTFGAQTLTQGGSSEDVKDAVILGAIFPPAIAGLKGAKEVVKMIPGVKDLGENLGARVINSLIGTRVKDFAYSKNPGRGIAELGITANSFGELGAKVKSNLETSGQAIGSLLQGLPELRVNVTKSLSYLDEAINQSVTTNNTTLLQRLGEVKQALTDTLGLENGKIVSTGTRDLANMTVQDANKLKQLVGDLTRWTTNVTEDNIANKALKQIYGSVRDSVETMVEHYDPKTAEKLRGLNETYGDLVTADKAITYRDKVIQGHSLVGLGGKVFGTGAALLEFFHSGGQTLPAVLAGLGGLALDKAMGSTAVKTRVARWLALASPEEKKVIFSKLPMLRGTIDRLFGGGVGANDVSPFPKVSEAITKGGKKIISQTEAVIKDVKKNPTKGGITLGDNLDPEVATALREAKGLSASDITAKHPDINLKREVKGKDISGKPFTIPEGEALTPYELKGNKVLLQDGETYIVSKNQYQNIKGNSVSGEAKEFAPELKGTEETVKGEVGMKQRDKAYADFDAGRITREERNAIIDKGGAPGTKYSQYQLPDGKNYKEVLIKAPKGGKATAQWQIKDKATGDVVKTFDYADEAKARDFWLKDTAKYEMKTTSISPDLKEVTGGFKSSHWDEPNVISHLRLNERTYQGKKVTFMEEVQSDWAREYRAGKVKDAPEIIQKKKETELGIKRALKEAVDNNSEYFAWINGEQTSARYNLATQVDTVKWNTGGNGYDGKMIYVNAKGGRDIIVKIDDKGNIMKGQTVPTDWVGKPLDTALGKGLADKIMADKTGTLSGEGLKFGGEWANNLYDKQVKNIVEDITGGKVEMLDMGLAIDANMRTSSGVSKLFFTTGKSPVSITKLSQLKVGLEISNNESNYIITDILGDGKFKAVPIEGNPGGDYMEIFSELTGKEKAHYVDQLAESFDISSKKSAGQQGIFLSPEIKSIIKGEGAKLKKPSGKSPIK